MLIGLQPHFVYQVSKRLSNAPLQFTQGGERAELVVISNPQFLSRQIISNHCSLLLSSRKNSADPGGNRSAMHTNGFRMDSGPGRLRGPTGVDFDHKGHGFGFKHIQRRWECICNRATAG